MSATDVPGEIRRGLHERLLGRVDARELQRVPRAERRMRVREEALAVLREQGHILPQGALARVVNEVSDAVVGTSRKVMNGPDDVYVEREGRIERARDGLFEGEESGDSYRSRTA